MHGDGLEFTEDSVTEAYDRHCDEGPEEEGGVFGGVWLGGSCGWSCGGREGREERIRLRVYCFVICMCELYV